MALPREHREGAPNSTVSREVGAHNWALLHPYRRYTLLLFPTQNRCLESTRVALQPRKYAR